MDWICPLLTADYKVGHDSLMIHIERLILIIILLGIGGAADATSLNRQLLNAAFHDDLPAAIKLLDQGADPIAPVLDDDGTSLLTALHQSAFTAMEKGTGNVYSEFIHRGANINVTAHSAAAGGDLLTPLDFVFNGISKPPQKGFEDFALRMLRDGADPFRTGACSWSLIFGIEAGFDRFTAEVLKMNVPDHTWSWVIGYFSKIYRFLSYDPTYRANVIRVLKEYGDALIQHGLPVEKWGMYSKKQSQQTLHLDYPLALMPARVGSRVDFELLNFLISKGLDINQILDSGMSACSSWNRSNQADYEGLVALGCKFTSNFHDTELRRRN
jgi:hypothetical protein